MDLSNYSFVFILRKKNEIKTPRRWISDPDTKQALQATIKQKLFRISIHFPLSLKWNGSEREKMGRKSAPLGIMLSSKQRIKKKTFNMKCKKVRWKREGKKILTGKWISPFINKQEMSQASVFSFFFLLFGMHMELKVMIRQTSIN